MSIYEFCENGTKWKIISSKSLFLALIWNAIIPMALKINYSKFNKYVTIIHQIYEYFLLCSYFHDDQSNSIECKTWSTMWMETLQNQTHSNCWQFLLKRKKGSIKVFYGCWQLCLSILKVGQCLPRLPSTQKSGCQPTK